MIIYFNNEPLKLSNTNMTLADLVKMKDIPSQGTAIAINDKLVKQDQWSVKTLNDQDRVTVITAAFGG